MNIKKIVGLSFFVMISIIANAAVKLPTIFQSNMVLQRDKEIQLWGFATVGEEVVITLNGQHFKAATDKEGKWIAKLPAQSAGGPYNIIVEGDSTLIELKNVLFGDVWICGGQSNMQYTTGQIGYKPNGSDTTTARLRLFTAAINQDYVPTEDLAGGQWRELSAAAIKDFSATAFFFGKFLQDTLNVPIGLVSVNLGATSVETWMSKQAISAFPQFNDFYQTYLASGKSKQDMNYDFAQIKAKWETDYYLKGKGLEEKWYLPETNVSDWKTMDIPNWWEDQGEKDFDGAIWFRKTFDLPKDATGDSLNLALNQIDDYDMTWVNGHKVGESYGNQNWRNYKVPLTILKPKNNVLVVRVFDIGHKGGMYSHAIWGNPILLGKWQYKPDYKIESAKFKVPLVPNISPFTTPCVLYNANIAPLTKLAIKGFIWYQGESNADRAAEYGTLFPTLVKDWRTHFDQGNLPFLFVQLANYMQEAEEPQASTWAELRQAQTSVLKLPNTGMAVTIDIGEANDIHPKNKMDVGKRLGLSALRVAYQKAATCNGPTFKSIEKKGSTLIVHYLEGSNRLVSRNKYGYVSGFAIAGVDNTFQWAKARIEGNTIVLSSKKVPHPINVRYAWSDNPGTIDLYNHAGLPAAPFRTDNLPLTTSGKQFSLTPWQY